MSIAVTLTLVALFVLAPIVLFRQAGNAYKHHPDEPPLAPQLIPFIGHLIGLTKYKFDYYVKLSRQIQAPIFTMHLPGQKMYVVTSPKLIQAVQKQHRTIAFGPIRVKITAKVGDISPQGIAIMEDNVLQDQGDWGIDHDSSIVFHEGMRPGPDLDVMNRAMIREVSQALEWISPRAQGGKTILKLDAWLRRTLSAATTNSVYGSKNPYKDPEIVKAFWDYEYRLMSFVTGIANRLTAPKAIAARSKIAAAFEKYYSSDGLKDAAPFSKRRNADFIRYNVALEDVARFEVVGSLGFLINTIPASFWLLYFLFSDKNLLQDVRAEIDAAMRTSRDEQGNITRALDVTSLKENCPLLLSTFQETLRHRSMGAPAREVVEDTILDGRWLLKKGAMVQMPSRVVHTDPSLWGTDVDEFKPRRFLKGEKQLTETGNRPGDICFRAFGGGKSLCPGRHFATNEMIALVSVILARYDLQPVAGVWKMPTTLSTGVAAVIMQPDHDIEVEVLERKGFEGDTWEISLRESEKMFAMVAEDVNGVV